VEGGVKSDKKTFIKVLLPKDYIADIVDGVKPGPIYLHIYIGPSYVYGAKVMASRKDRRIVIELPKRGAA
jgi:hypothetical protein